MKRKETEQPKLYLSRYPSESGVEMWTCIFGGCPIMAETRDEETARQVYAGNAGRLRIAGPAPVWNGHAGEFEARA
jgi:hypothetical protein